MNALYCFLFLAVGNAATVVLSQSSVLSAVERTYFQGVALLIYWILTNVIWKDQK